MSRYECPEESCLHDGCRAETLASATSNNLASGPSAEGGSCRTVSPGLNMPLLVYGCACPQGDMPFMVEETKNSRGARIRVTEEDAWELLAGVRGELEVGMGPCQGVARVRVPGIVGFIPTSNSCLCNAAWLMQACVVQACLLKLNPRNAGLMDMQALRTLADQVRKRERLKKQLLRNWREQLKLVSAMLHLQLNSCQLATHLWVFAHGCSQC
jgi:hypothetical protein